MKVEEVMEYIKRGGNWYTSKVETQDVAAEIIRFHFIAHESLQNDLQDTMPTNHWSLLFEIGTKSCVHLDMIPGADLSKPGVIALACQEYPLTTKNPKTVSIDAPQGVTVADIFSLIIENKRDKYVFAPVGEGCRFWLHTLVGDFSTVGFVTDEHAEEVQAALRMYWPSPEGTTPVFRTIMQGHFLQ